MAISAPANPTQKLWQPAAKFVVYLGPSTGENPDNGIRSLASCEVDYLLPLRITRTAGGGRDDVLLFQFDLARQGKRIQDLTMVSGIKKQVEIRQLDDNGQPTQIVGWGFLSANPIQIGSDGEMASIEARICQHHFGKPLTNFPVWDYANNRQLLINSALTFNPEIDEIIEGNMSNQQSSDGWKYVMDPESARSTNATDYQHQRPSTWQLKDAVNFLCSWLNPSETYISNPWPADLESIFKDRGLMLKNVEIPIGTWLPEALDRVLAPFEYGWYLRHYLGGDSSQEVKDRHRKSRITFFQRGKGISRKIFLQRIGESRDIAKTTVSDLDIDYSINDLANRIEVYGDYLKLEKTFRLSPAWSTTWDSQDLLTLTRGEAFAEEHPSVGRKWVLNEAGDYIGVRPVFTAPFNFGSLFGDDNPQSVKRRRFLRCLSQHPDADDRESNGYRVDYYDWDADGATNPDDNSDPGWTRVKWPFAVLQKECGILFEGLTPPEILWGYFTAGTPEKALLRITATVAADQRISGVATRQDRSPNGQDVTLVLDLKDRFQMSKVDSASIFSSRPSTARDDSTVIQQYAEQIRDIEDGMKIHSSVVLEGVCHPVYEIGNLVDDVEGRNLMLNAFDPSYPAGQRYPQIVGVVHHLQGGQHLELMLDSYQRERPQIVMDNHQRVLA